MNWIPDNSRLSPTENLKSETVTLIAIVQFTPPRQTRQRQDCFDSGTNANVVGVHLGQVNLADVDVAIDVERRGELGSVDASAASASERSRRRTGRRRAVLDLTRRVGAATQHVVVARPPRVPQLPPTHPTHANS